PRSHLGEGKINKNIPVALDGYFFKLFRYKANDRHGTMRDTPLVIGHGLRLLEPLAVAENPSIKSIRTLGLGMALSVLALIAGVVALTSWYRRSDERVRRRLQNRPAEFPFPDIDPEVQTALPVSGHSPRDTRMAPLRPAGYQLNTPDSSPGGTKIRGGNGGHHPIREEPPNEDPGG
ncbi:MAG: hypothetical protein ACKO23_14905, partial [Gemmataceae bacterium]